MANSRRAVLIVALSGVAAVLPNFDPAVDEDAFVYAWAVSSDSYPNVEEEIDRILDCQLQDLVAKERMRRIMRFDFDFESDPILMSIMLSYWMSVAASPTGTPANQIERFTQGVGLSGGMWQIGILVGSVVKLTQPLAWNATAAQVKTALENLSFIGRGNTTVIFDTDHWDVTLVNNWARGAITFSIVVANLTGGTITRSTPTAAVQRDHALTRIAGFQNVAFGLVAGFRNSNRLPKFYKSVVANTLTIRGSHADPRISANAGVIGSGEVPNVTSGWAQPACSIFRPSRFRDTLLVIDGVDYALNNLLRNFEASLSNQLVDDDDAYTAQDDDIHRLERGDERPFTINCGILGEEGDDIHVMAESLAEVPVFMRIGRSGHNISFDIPKASISLRNPVLSYDGSVKRSMVQIQIEPMLISGDATTPFTADANVDIATQFLLAA
jgi:hypothetical protein